jgi:hypothetical protein
MRPRTRPSGSRIAGVVAAVSIAVPIAVPIAMAGAGTAAADVAVGDVITAENREALRGLIPAEIFPYAIEDFDGLQMTVTETADYPPHPAYVEATARHACKTSLDDDGNLVGYVAGQPFPYSKWAQEATGHACDLSPDDPRFALKLAWNVNYRWQGPGHNYPHWGFSYMRNRGKDLWRLGQGEYRRTYFSHRADLLAETGSAELEEGTDVEWAEFFDVKDPFDLRGTMFLLYRYTDPGKEDDTWAYVPSLRRVRRVATTQKSDSLLGTEFTLEDFALFSGYVLDQKWEYMGEQVLLAVMNSDRKCFPASMGGDVDQRVIGMSRLGSREEWGACRWGPYGALPFVDEKWEKRVLFQLDDIPLQKGHPYSRKKIWYDRETMVGKYAITYDRAGEPYKILATVHGWSEDSSHPSNQGRNVPLERAITIVNLQSLNSHVAQFFSGNVHTFSVDDSLRYYDTTKLKRRGR